MPVEDSQLTSDKNIALLQEECNNICNDCGCIGFYCGDECLCECYNGQLDEERLKDIASRKFQYVILIQSENGTKLLSNGEDVKGVELIDTVEDEDIFSTNMLREKRDAPPPPPPPPASGPIVSQPIASQPKDVEPIVGHAAPAEEGGAGLLKLKLPAIKAINVKEKFLEWKARAAAAAGAIAIKVFSYIFIFCNFSILFKKFNLLSIFRKLQSQLHSRKLHSQKDLH